MEGGLIYVFLVLFSQNLVFPVNQNMLLYIYMIYKKI